MKSFKNCLLIVILSSLTTFSFGTSYTWTGATDTAWTTASNWSPSGVPDSADNATIVTHTKLPIIFANRKITNLTLTSGTLTLNGNTLTVQGTAALNGGTITSGKLSCTGTVITFHGTNLKCYVNASCGQVKLNGCVFDSTAYLKQTGGANGNGEGGNTFNQAVTFETTGGFNLRTAQNSGDVFNGNLTVYSGGSGSVQLSYATNSTYNGNIYLSSTSTGGIVFGNTGDSSTTTLASGKALIIGSSGYKNGTLVLRKIIQLGSTAQSLTIDSASNMSITGCTFNGAVNFSAPTILCKTTTFNAKATLTKTSNSNNDWYGGNVFNDTTVINNNTNGNYNLRMATTAGDAFNSAVTFNASTTYTGNLNVAYADTTTFKGNVSINNSKVIFNGGTGRVKFTGSNSQTLSGSATYAMLYVIVNKSSNSITLNQSMTIDSSLTLTKGNVVSTSTYLLTMKAGSSISGASDSGYVDGPVKKIGNTAFTFPTGKSGNYRAIGISAPSSSSDAFMAEFTNSGQSYGSSKDSTLGQLNSCDYWTLTRPTGSSSVNAIPFWNQNSCFIANPSDMRVASWNGSKWIDKGNTAYTGTMTSGSITSSSNSVFTAFALSNKLLCSDSLNLGNTTKFALLSGGTISSSSGIHSIGKVGAVGSITNISATDSVLSSNSGSVPYSITQLTSAIAFCNGLSGSVISGTLKGQSLSAGVYEINGNATVDSVLTLSGDTTSKYFFKIRDSLIVKSNALVQIGNVRSSNIFWIVNKGCSINQNILFPGTVLAKLGVNITLNNKAHNSLLALQNISITHDSTQTGDDEFYSNTEQNNYYQNLNISCSMSFGGCNYVRNGKFDLNSATPKTAGQMNYSCPWLTTNTTSDYFNTNTVFSGIDVPTNNFGYQQDHTVGGSGMYAGFIAYDTVNATREYLQEQLFSTLTNGTKYYAEMFVNKSNKSKYAVSTIGMYFTSTKPNQTGFGKIDTSGGNRLIESTSLISDTSSWTRISKCFTANGTEQYLTIGNFKDNAHSGAIAVNSSWSEGGAYYYVDDIAVVPFVADGGSDTLFVEGDSTVQLGQTNCISNLNTGQFTYLWSPVSGSEIGVLSNTNTYNPTLTVVNRTTDTITYNYQVQVTAPDGSTATDRVMIMSLPQILLNGPTSADMCDSTRFEFGFGTNDSVFNINLSAVVLNGTDTISVPYPNCANTNIAGNNAVVIDVDSVVLTSVLVGGQHPHLSFTILGMDSTTNTDTIHVTIDYIHYHPSYEIKVWYKIHLDCSLIQDSLSTIQTLQLVQHFNVGGLSGTDSTAVPVPHFVDLGSTLSVAANFGQRDTMLFQYPNSGTGLAHINFSFHDIYLSHCTTPAYRVDSIKYAIGSAVPSVFSKTVNPGFNNVDSVPNGQSLFIKQYITIIDCYNVCPADSHWVQFSWQCANIQSFDFCPLCEHKICTPFVLNTEIPSYSIRRLLPSLSAALFDSTCLGDTVLWRVQVVNTSTFTVFPFDTLHFYNPSYGISGLSIIYSNTIQTVYSVCDSCSVTYVKGAGNSSSACNVNYSTNPSLPNFDVCISNFAPNDTIVFQFKTYKCCNSDDTLLGYNKAYNQWVILSNATTQCNNIVNPDTNTLEVNIYHGISGHSTDPNADINLNLYFSPQNPLHLTVPTGVSNFGPYTAQEIHLSGIFGSVFDEQALGYTPSTPQISGFLKADIECATGLIIDNMDSVTLFFIDTSHFKHTLMPVGHWTTRQDSDSCMAAHYFFYYNLNHPGIEAFLGKGVLRFKMQSCCAADPQTNYDVTFSLMPDSSCFADSISTDTLSEAFHCLSGSCCWLPLSKAGYHIAVHCPGCRAPGVIVNSYNMFRNSFGFKDADNNRAIDSTVAVPIDSTYIANFDTVLNRNGAVHGDELIDKLSAHFFNGDPTILDPLDTSVRGYTYEGDMLSHGITLRTLQLVRTIPFSNDSFMDLQVLSANLYIDIRDSITPECIDCDGYDNTFGNSWQTLIKLSIPESGLSGFFTRSSNKFFWSFPLDSLQATNGITTYDNFDNTQFAFHAGQQYRLSVRYRACGNIHVGTFDNLQHSYFDKISEINNIMWLTGSGFTLGNYLAGNGMMPNMIYTHDTADADMEYYNLAFVDSPYYCTTCVHATDSNFADQFQFYCESYGSVFHFYSTDLLTTISYNPGNSYACTDEVYITINNLIARRNPALDGTLKDIFPYEYKPPGLFPARIVIRDVPSGYTLSPTAIIHSTYYKTDIFNPVLINAANDTMSLPPVILNGDSIVIDTLNFQNELHDLGYLNNNTIPYTFPHLVIADEESSQLIKLTLFPTCDALPGLVYPHRNRAGVLYTDNHTPVSIPLSDTSTACEDVGFLQNNIYYDGSQAQGHWQSPSPNLQITFNQSANATNSQVCWNFNMQNLPVTGIGYTSAQNIFIAVPSISFLNSWHVNWGASTYSAVNGIIGFEDYFALSQSSNQSGSICATYFPCAGSANTPIDFFWGWNCDSFPASLDTSLICDTALHVSTVNLHTQLPSLAPCGTQSPPGVYLCDTTSISACFYNTNPGAAVPFQFNITNPDTLLITSVILSSLNTGDSVDLGNSALSFAITQANLDSIFHYSYMEYLDTLVITVNFTALCQMSTKMLLPSIQLQYNTYCSADTVNVIATFDSVPVQSHCKDCFIVDKTASPLSIVQGIEHVFDTIVVSSNNIAGYTATVAVSEQYPAGYTPLVDPFSVNPINLTMTGAQTNIFYAEGLLDSGACNIVNVYDTANTLLATDTACVTLLPNCSAGCFVIPDSSRFDSLQYISGFYSASCFDVQGVFFIDGAAIFSGDTLYMEPGAEVIVGKNKSIAFKSCYLHGCSKMWKGISLDSASVLYAENTTLSDAQYAARAGQVSKISLVGCKFIDNYESILIPSNGVSLSVSGCWFKGTGSMKTNFQGQTPLTGDHPFSAMDVNHHNLFMRLGTPTKTNHFVNLSNGIISRYGPVNIYNCKFSDIQPDNAYDTLTKSNDSITKFNGSAIYALGIGTDAALTHVGFGSSSSSGTLKSFVNCNYGIFSDAMYQVYITNNKTDSVNTAFHVIGTRISTQIVASRLDTWKNAIELLQCDVGHQTLVLNNTITFGNNDFGKQYSGIYITENNGNPLKRDFRVNLNTISFRSSSTAAYTGINLNAVTGYFITENTINMNDNAVNHDGIFASGCFKHTISCNNITGSGTAYDTSSTQSAIANEMGTSPLIGCNVVDKTNNGIFIIGPISSFIDISGNEFNEHQYGLRYSSSSIVPNSLNWRGNQWDTVLISGSKNAYNQSLNAVTNLVNGSSYPYFPVLLTPSNWFQPAAGTNYQCEDAMHDYCAQFEPPCNPCPAALDRLIAKDSIQNDPYTLETQWMLKKALYEKLDNDTTLLSDSLMNAFYISMQTTVIKPMKDVEDRKEVLFTIDSTLVNYFDEKHNDAQVKMDTLQVKMEALNVALDNNDPIAAIISDINDIQSELADISVSSDSTIATGKDVRFQNADSIKTSNDLLGTSAIIESNEKTVNQIYLTTIAKDRYTFTEAQRNVLYSIALQCPLVGGNAVFRARSLYYLVNPFVYYDDFDICDHSGVSLRTTTDTKESKPNKFRIYPNPSNRNATLIYELEKTVAGEFLISNAYGQLIKDYKLNQNNTSFGFSTFELAPGIYYCTVLSNGQRVDTIKMVIIH